MNTDTRADFEAWAQQFKYDLSRSDCNSSEPYAQPVTDWSWLAWESATVRAKDRIAILVEALQTLLDEQNDAPLERRCAQWQAAMGAGRAAIRKATGSES